MPSQPRDPHFAGGRAHPHLGHHLGPQVQRVTGVSPVRNRQRRTTPPPSTCHHPPRAARPRPGPAARHPRACEVTPASHAAPVNVPVNQRPLACAGQGSRSRSRARLHRCGDRPLCVAELGRSPGGRRRGSSACVVGRISAQDRAARLAARGRSSPYGLRGGACRIVPLSSAVGLPPKVRQTSVRVRVPTRWHRCTH